MSAFEVLHHSGHQITFTLSIAGSGEIHYLLKIHCNITQYAWLCPSVSVSLLFV